MAQVRRRRTRAVRARAAEPGEWAVSGAFAFWNSDPDALQGKAARIFCTTMGCSVDFESEGYRRLLVNACYWGLGMEAEIPAKSKVELVGPYKPTPFGGGKFTKGVKPADFKL